MLQPLLFFVCALFVFGFFYIAALISRIARRATDQHDLMSALIGQVRHLDKKLKRSVDLLEDIRDGRGPESDRHRLFGEAEEQKAALFQLLKRSSSERANQIAVELKREVLRLYTDLIRRFPGTREATIARERCEEIETAIPNP
jgi:hypothetical protein